ncbi:hypothetical protein RV11_GL000852 [Enterococcus phoeniculicola]|jgi:nitrogen fixation-related uncharacterized protein|uniref:Uncharacterized protein n=1 Tax=Enterococcus phoeniculicola ATCC BAA-412 TaxID=1158610 RepID=R3WN90_9ENTE|nr:hypothetical protein [Enterococcus phoeniculicola]EOL48897.1 hypothetical protein UC3_00449 [Enterococcus phoeniculicola ATCC BAA-412]EOT72743.1 hypothetical protein I589_03013 [Enterococcus phoeniculicola ATCC BAA-412]OJG70790.1 hypothetical protein RV11_GL000852 [Enterococcus phoeniculicola]
MKKWMTKKSVYIPVSIVLGGIGVGAFIGSMLGVDIEDKLNKEYYKSKEEPLFKKDEK